MSLVVKLPFTASFSLPDRLELNPVDKNTPLPMVTLLLENFSEDELDQLCVDFRRNIFKKAGKKDPENERPAAAPHWKEAYNGQSLLQLLLVVEDRINSFTQEMENSYEAAIAGNDFSKAYEELKKVLSILQEAIKS